VLLEFLEDAYPASTHLLPPTPVERARSRIWSDHISKKICPAFYSFLQAREALQIQANREVLLSHLKTFVKAMAPAEKGPYFFGEQFTTVDIMLLPWALRFSLVLKQYRGFELPRSGEREGEEGIWERFAKWEDAALARQSVQRTTSDPERYIGVYKRYADNTTQSEVAKATRAGKPLP
jgi:glutathione S-transferase